MINLGIRYFNKDNTSGVVLAGDRGAPDPTSSSVIVESDPFIQIGDFPVLFAPKGYYNTAIISDFTLSLTEYFNNKFKNPSSFTVVVFKNIFHILYEQLNIMSKYYSESESKESLFEFILAGSDTKGEVLLYYGEVRNRLCIEDINYIPGYIVSDLGRHEGMATLTSMIGSKKITKPIAEETALAVLEMLRRIKIDMSGHFELIGLEKGEILPMKKENILRHRGLTEYRWDAIWSVLRNSIKEPKYADYILDKYRGIK